MPYVGVVDCERVVDRERSETGQHGEQGGAHRPAVSGLSAVPGPFQHLCSTTRTGAVISEGGLLHPPPVGEGLHNVPVLYGMRKTPKNYDHPQLVTPAFIARSVSTTTTGGTCECSPVFTCIYALGQHTRQARYTTRRLRPPVRAETVYRLSTLSERPRHYQLTSGAV